MMLRTNFSVFQVDKDGNGFISLSEYFAIFEEHGIRVNQAETNRCALEDICRLLSGLWDLWELCGDCG